MATAGAITQHKEGGACANLLPLPTCTHSVNKFKLLKFSHRFQSTKQVKCQIFVNQLLHHQLLYSANKQDSTDLSSPVTTNLSTIHKTIKFSLSNTEACNFMRHNGFSLLGHTVIGGGTGESIQTIPEMVTMIVTLSSVTPSSEGQCNRQFHNLPAHNRTKQNLKILS